MLTSPTLQEPSTIAENPKRDTADQLQQLTTESQNEASQGLDTKSALEIARIINHEDAKIAAAVKKALPEIAQVIDQVARALRDGGRLIYIGAGSSGRIAALDSSECPPTYSSAPGQVQYIMAGGPKALASAVEVNEDSERAGSARYCPGAVRPVKTWSSAFPPQAGHLMWLRLWLTPALAEPGRLR